MVFVKSKVLGIFLICILALSLGCNDSYLFVKSGSIKGNKFGRYVGFNTNYTGSGHFTTLAMQVTDLTPIHERYQAYGNLISGYNFAIDPLITSDGLGGYLAKPDDLITREQFFILLKSVFLDNMRFSYETGTVNVFECTNSIQSAITGATVSDITSSNAAFQSIQCLVDNNFSSTVGLFAANSVRPNDNLKRGQMITIIQQLLSLWLNEIQQIPSSNACVTQNQIYIKNLFKTLIAQLSIFPEAHAQMTSVSQLTDLTPASPYYNAVLVLMESYGIAISYVYSDSTARLDNDATYSDVVALFDEMTSFMISLAPSYTCPP